MSCIHLSTQHTAAVACGVAFMLNGAGGIGRALLAAGAVPFVRQALARGKTPLHALHFGLFCLRLHSLCQLHALHHSGQIDLGRRVLGQHLGDLFTLHLFLFAHTLALLSVCPG